MTPRELAGEASRRARRRISRAISRASDSPQTTYVSDADLQRSLGGKSLAEVNIARAIEELKALGVWTVGLAGEGPESYEAIDFTLPTAVVLGAEGAGLRRLVRERCDRLASIPMRGHVGSLNVSVAAGIVLFEAVRQRSLKNPSRPGKK